MKKFILGLIRPRSKNDDVARKEFILNILLSCIIVLSIFALLANILYLFSGTGQISAVYSTSIILFIFLFLFFLSRRGKHVVSANLFISSMTLICLLASAQVGVHFPQILLIYALIIIMSGILISATFSMILSVIISFTLIIISTNSKSVGLKTIEWQMQDTVVAVITIAIISVMSWLSTHEIEKSLKRARKSEADLKKERDSLEIKVEERTNELKASQLKQLAQMSHFAEMGKLASGIFHDLVNPLTAVSLNLEQLKSIDSKQMQGVSIYLKQALTATNKMDDFIRSVKKQISTAEFKNNFSPAREITDSISILHYKCNEKGICISTDIELKTKLYGNPLKYSQIITNLLSNSIDALCNQKDGRKINIKLYESNDCSILEVTDNGCGISDEIKDKVFDPFVTTKDFDKGTGIGLSTVKEVVENHFNGKISFETNDKGTKFSVLIPIKQEQS